MGTILQRMKIQNTICQWEQFYRGWWFKILYVNGEKLPLQIMMIQRTICQWQESRFQIESWYTAPYINRGENWLQKEWWCKAPYIKWWKIASETMICKAPLNSKKIVTYDMDKNNCKIHYSEVQNLWENPQHILYASGTIQRNKKSLTTLKVISKCILVATCTNIHMQYTERPSYNIIIDYEEEYLFCALIF